MLVVVGYFKVAVMRDAMDQLAIWKAAGGVLALGLVIAVIASIVSGAVAPEIAKVVALRQTTFDRARWIDFVYNAAIFGAFGLTGDLFYRWMGHLFPPDGTITTIAIKTAIDQFVYSPLITLPSVALVFTCRRLQWNASAILKEIGLHWYLKHVVGLILLCWCYWIPMCMLMYALPASLTFVFAMFAQAAWALLLVFAAGHSHLPEPVREDAAPRVAPADAEAAAIS